VVVKMRDVVGLGALALVVAGVWGWLGWPAGVIAAGLPFAGFWAFGEYQAAVRSWGDYE
jgi:hypothetical protein